MDSDAKIMRVVVASPSDVQDERDKVPVVVDELNRGVAADRGLRLEVYRWETDAYPGFHAEGPQGLIDSVLRIEDSDIFIGIFWRRFGSTTANGKTGTEHEIALAHEAYRKNNRPQIMVYFNQKAYAPKSVEEINQWRKVLRFRRAFPKEGLWWAYKGPSDFEKQLRIHITNFIRDRFRVGVQAAIVARHQLRSPVRDFTGREEELEELMVAVVTKNVSISGLQGLGGVGKTELALALAERLKPRYPDAQFYLDLKGVSGELNQRGAPAEPLSPSDAMAHVVRSYHPTAKLPKSEAEMSGLYRSVLDGQRALLIMDNARDKKQVEPLIPPSSSLLIVTSRKHFTLPGLYTKNLEALTPGQARDLLLKIAPRIKGHADQLAKLCGYLPLALRLAASAIAERVDLAPVDYIKRLTNARKLLELVEASLSLSYELLTPEMQKLFRALGVFPGAFDCTAAAFVWEMKHQPAQDTLSELVAYSFLQFVGEEARSSGEAVARYRLHDLVRLFAHAKLSPAERIKALKRYIIQETALRAFRVIDTFYEGGDFVAWVMRIGRNLMIDQWRAQCMAGIEDPELPQFDLELVLKRFYQELETLSPERRRGLERKIRWQLLRGNRRSNPSFG